MEEFEQPVQGVAAAPETASLPEIGHVTDGLPDLPGAQNLKAAVEVADASLLQQLEQEQVHLLNEPPEADPEDSAHEPPGDSANEPPESSPKDSANEPPESAPKEPVNEPVESEPKTANEKPMYKEMGTMTSDFEELRGMVFLPETKLAAPPTGDELTAQLGEETRVRVPAGQGELVSQLEGGDNVTEGGAARVKTSLHGEAVPNGAAQLVMAQRSIMEVELGAGETEQAGGQLSMSSVDATFGSPESKRKGGLRCEVCKRVKKAGCGTENAHPRCERRPHDTSAFAQLEMEHLIKLAAIDEDERVSLWNPTTKQRLSGMAAPMLRNLPAWLANHKGWEPVEKPPEGAPSKKRRRASAPAPVADHLVAATDSSGQQSPMANPPQTPNPMETPEGAAGTPVPVKTRPTPEPPTPEELERQREAAAEMRRLRKELGPRCEVCQTIKKAGCGTEDANARCLRHPRRGPDGKLVPLAPSEEAAEKRSVEKKPLYKYEGGRCEVCTAIKKGGCGTETAHRRCLKNPRGTQTALSPLQAMTNGHDDPGADIIPVMIEQQRVTLWHPEKKQKLCGMAAPMLKNLDNYLRMHPGWIAVRRFDEMLSVNPDDGLAEDPNEVGDENLNEVGVEHPSEVGAEVFGETGVADPNEAVAVYTNEAGVDNQTETGVEGFAEAAVVDPNEAVDANQGAAADPTEAANANEAVDDIPKEAEAAIVDEVMASAPDDVMDVDPSRVETDAPDEGLAPAEDHVMDANPLVVETAVLDKVMAPRPDELMTAAVDGVVIGDGGVAQATEELVAGQ